MTDTPRPSRRDLLSRLLASRLVPVLLLAIFAGSAIVSMSRESATFDEPAHVGAGFGYLTYNDYHLNYEHPPLVKKLAALPVVLAGAAMPTGQGEVSWRLGKEWPFGYRLLYRTPGNDADRLLFLARLPMVGLGLCLGLLVFLFARDLAGPTGARIALFCYAFCPTMLAHTRIVATDLGLGLFFLATLYAVFRAGRRLTPWTLIAPGVALGLALATKFSALMLLPIVGALLLVRCLDPEPLPVRLPGVDRVLATRAARCRVMAGLLLLTILLAWVILWGSYGFRYGMVASLDVEPDRDAMTYNIGYRANHPGFTAVVDTIARYHLVPEAYLDGFTCVTARSERRNSYLMGNYSYQGFRSFFPVAFLVKTPVAFLLVLVPALACLARREYRWGALCLALGGGVYGATALASTLNIGHRHLLPLYPVLYVAVATLHPLLKRPLVAGLMGLLSIWYLGAWLYISPHYLAYFNELAGGPARGDRYLVDSSLDWGQDLKALGQFVREQRLRQLPLSYFGTASPNYYGITPFIRLPGEAVISPDEAAETWTMDDVRAGKGEFVAISVTNLRGLYLREGADYYAEFWDREPVARLGWSINVYRNPWYGAAGGSAAGSPP